MSVDGKILDDGDVGRDVTYVPNHAGGNAGHRDCERGVITSWNSRFVFVRFGSSATPKACYPFNLVWG